MSLSDLTLSDIRNNDFNRSFLMIVFNFSIYVEFLEARPESIIDILVIIGGLLSIIGIISTVLMFIHKKFRE